MKSKLYMFVIFLLFVMLLTAAAYATSTTEGIGHITMVKANTSIAYLYRTFIQIPVQMVYGPDGCIYVADWTGHHVVKLDQDYNATELGLGEAQRVFYSDGPRGLAFDSQGNLYISNHGHICRMDTEGNIEELPFIQGSPVGSIAISPSDELYYTDRGQGRLLKWTPENGSQVIADDIPYAENLVFGLDGTLYLTQMGYWDLLKMDVATGEWSVFLKNVCGFDPCYLAVDPEGDIWIRAIFTLYQYSPDGKKKAYVIDGKSSDTYQWHTSAGVAVDDEGGVWIASINSKITHLIPTELGAADPDFTLDVAHTGFEASDLAIDSNGTVYAADINGMQILKIDAESEAEALMNSGSAARQAVAVDENDCVYYTNKGKIWKIDRDGNNTFYADVSTERMVFAADGNLYAVKIKDNGNKVIVCIPKKECVITIAAKICDELLGTGAVHISPATNEGLYVFVENTRNLYFIDFEGNGRLIKNYSQLGGGVFCMAANPVSGDIYLIPHGSYILYEIVADGSYQELAKRIFGDPWGMVVSGDGATLFVAESGVIEKITLNQTP
ncbi:MAG: hypothetical protein JW811_03230 [Clostridiales bacterium]|nr:hypothetical protein [Clostridiales bacterium]